MQGLIDGDVLRYRIGFACEEIIDGEVVPDTIENCLHSVKEQIHSILREAGADSYRVFLSGKGNFRESLVDYYKANRKDSRKPYHFDNITQYLINYWDAEVIEGQEADDALGIAQVQNKYIVDQQKLGGHGYTETIICTIDKDLDNVPGWHYNFLSEIGFSMN